MTSLKPICFSLLVFGSFLFSCQKKAHHADVVKDTVDTEEHTEDASDKFYYGADLSYVNEMEDCGAVFKDADGNSNDPYTLFSNAGTNLVRLRLWQNPDWTSYSNLNDVKRSLARAKKEGMQTLLDFHYSDDWADPGKQEIPKAWEEHLDNTPVLGGLVYDYTYNTLMELHQEELLPELVQVGNETNSMILRKGEDDGEIDWERNSYLLNKGIEAVRKASADLGKPIGIVLHIAQPENALWWFKDAKTHGVTDYDWIGLSYYPNWSEYKFDRLEEALTSLIETHQKKLMIVETAYPFSLENIDEANNILGTEALINGYPATQQGQLEYLLKLEDIVKASGGQGVIYWEPAWVSTSCQTRWGTGSHWDNATLFDSNGEPTLGMEFYEHSTKK